MLVREVRGSVGLGAITHDKEVRECDMHEREGERERAINFCLAKIRREDQGRCMISCTPHWFKMLARRRGEVLSTKKQLGT